MLQKVIQRIDSWKKKFRDYHVKVSIMPSLVFERTAGLSQREHIITTCCWAVYTHPEYLNEIMEQSGIKDYTLESVATHTDLIQKDDEGNWEPKLPWSNTAIQRLNDYPQLRSIVTNNQVLQRIGHIPGVLDVIIGEVTRFKVDIFPLQSNPQLLVDYWNSIKHTKEEDLILKEPLLRPKVLYQLYSDAAHLKAGHTLVFILGNTCMAIKKEGDYHQYGYTQKRWGLEITIIERNRIPPCIERSHVLDRYITVWRK